MPYSTHFIRDMKALDLSCFQVNITMICQWSGLDMHNPAWQLESKFWDDRSRVNTSQLWQITLIWPGRPHTYNKDFLQAWRSNPGLRLWHAGRVDICLVIQLMHIQSIWIPHSLHVWYTCFISASQFRSWGVRSSYIVRHYCRIYCS